MNVLNALSAKIHRFQQSLGLIGWGLACRLIGPVWLAAALVPLPGVALEPEAALAPEVALATFDEVWDQVRTTHYDYERVREDWERLREPLRSEAEAAEDLAALRAVLVELLAVLDDSHYTILPAELMAAGRDDSERDPEQAQASGVGATGIRIALVDDQVLITRVEPESPSAAAGLDEGMAIISIDDQPVADQFKAMAGLDDDRSRRWARTFFQSAIQDRIGWPDRDRALVLEVRQVDGQERRVEIEPGPAAAQTFQAGTLPPMRFKFDSDRVERDGGHCIGTIEFTTWVPALGVALERALPPLLDCRGLVFDLRGNIGGVMGMMMPASGWLFDEATTLGTMRNPAGQIQFRALPRRVLSDGTAIRPFTGPVAILVDAASVSTSEMFTAGLQDNGRARVFGSRTPGMALPANARQLSSGDSLMYVMADYIGPTGERIEGGGVVPDQPVTPTPATLAACEDPVLLAAFDWIEDRSGSPSCSTN